MSAAAPLLGIDLGGTKIEMAVLDAQGGFLLRERTPTPQGDYDATLAAIAALVHRAEETLGLHGLPLGMGVPGSVSPRSGHMRGANSTVLNGRPLQQDLQALLGRPVLLENDANCLAVSEAVDGAGAGQRVVFAVILGTGVGGGIAMDGKVLEGHNRIAGEWGHNPLPWPSHAELDVPACWCGQRGCIETWVSGSGFSQDHLRASGERLAAQDIVAAMHRGDAQAVASFDRYCDRLARSLAHAINLIDPDVIVLGGGMSNVPPLYDRVPELLKRHVFSDVLSTPLLPARHGDSSGVRGAAWLTRPR